MNDPEFVEDAKAALKKDGIEVRDKQLGEIMNKIEECQKSRVKYNDINKKRI